MILDIINTYGAEILGAVLLALAGAFGRVMYKLASNFINEEIIVKVARTVVRFVEQVFTDLHGEEKLDKALQHFSEMLAGYGIHLSADRMKVYIEAAVREMNEAFCGSLAVVDGIAVEDMTDDMLRDALKQMGFAYTDTMNRKELLDALTEAASTAAAN